MLCGVIVLLTKIIGDNNIIAEIKYNPKFKGNEIRIIKNEKIE